MFAVIGFMFTGMLAGFLLRRRRLTGIHTAITLLIWLLLFLLGMDAGSNPDIINGLHALGMEALLLTLAALLGSVTAAWGLWRLLYKKKKEGQA